MSQEFINKLLIMMAEFDSHECLFWNGNLEFFINCSDVFYWASSDLEPITEKTIGHLRIAFEDASAAYEDDLYGTELYCCRMRKIRLHAKSI